MPKLVHTIKIVDERRNNVHSTRESTSRRYLACIVATTTKAVRAWEASRLAVMTKDAEEHEEKAADYQAKLDGMTVDEARVVAATVHARWYNDVDGYGPTYKRLLAEHGGGYVEKLTERFVLPDMYERGFESIDIDSRYWNCSMFVTYTTHAENLRESIANRTPEVIGSQVVVSWHQSVALAQKELASRSLHHLRARGDEIEIRTDIEIREVTPRARKR